MRLKIIYTCLLTTFLFSNIISQTTEYTLIDRNSHVDGVLLDRLDPGAKKVLNQYFEKQVKEKSYKYLLEFFESSQRFSLSRLSDIEKFIRVDENGLPNPLLPKSAIKKLSKNNITAGPYIQITTNCRIEGDVVAENDMLQRIQPNIQTVITLFDNRGKMISKHPATSVYPNYIDAESISKDGFSKSNMEHIDILIELFDELIKETVERALTKIKI